MENQAALPAELEREIFESAALLHPATIPDLLRVARRVHIWIEPFLYRFVLFEQPYTAGTRALLQKPPEFWNLAVRHVVLLHWGDAAIRMLNTCKGITSLGFDFGDPVHSATALTSVLPQCPIRRLAVWQLPRIAPELRRSQFGAITHLALFDFYPTITLAFCAEIPHLPALTHCSLYFFPTAIPTDLLMQTLADAPRLHLLLVFTHADGTGAIPAVYDVRFVITQFPTTYWDVWEAGVKGLPDYWSCGDDFVAKKRRGEIAATQYWLN
ncbi:hypothetical protein C8R46DRAFT_993579 [Mycena filopes]|nr:hypothetical protein C8R46DRAFT_993579 [Mycena filopes]